MTKYGRPDGTTPTAWARRIWTGPAGAMTEIRTDAMEPAGSSTLLHLEQEQVIRVRREAGGPSRAIYSSV